MIPVLLLLVLFGGALAPILVRHRGALPWLALVPMLLALLTATWAAAVQPVIDWSWWGPHIRPQLAIVGIGRVLVVLVPLIALPVVLYAAARDQPGTRRLLVLLLAFTGAMELVAMAGDFLTLLIGWELVGACSWGLIGHEWRDAARPRAALQAFITTRLGDLGLYLAAAAAFAATGSVRFDTLSGAPSSALQVIAGGVLLAAAAKSAQLPFSPWLFSAMAGPTAASALLHSATMVAAGAYLVARLAPALEATGWFLPAVAWLGLATALAGGVVASLQSNLKKALAASTSAQYGLMFVATGAGSTAAATVHLVTHAAFKALLFLGAGIVLHAAGTLDLARLRLGSALPTVARLFAVGALALAAVPPLGAAFSKEQVLAAAAGSSFGGAWLVVGMIAAGFLSAVYAGRIYLLAFAPGESSGVAEPATAERWSLALLAGLSVALGLLWIPAVARLVEGVVLSALPDESVVLFGASVVSIGAAGALCWRLWNDGHLLTFGLPAALRTGVAAWLGLPVLAQRLVVDPVRRFSRALAAFDDRVVDAGSRAAATVSTVISGLMSRWGERGFEEAGAAVTRLTTGLAFASAGPGERGIDGAVVAVSRLTTVLAGVSQRADDRGIDSAVERVAREIGWAGHQSRRLQTGLAHHYYVILAAGALIVLAVAAFGR